MSWKVGHPLRLDGTSQRQRLSKALHPDFVPIDDRSESELLLLLARLAKQFTYYNFENLPDGNWEAFFPMEWKDETTGVFSVLKIKNYIQTNNDRGTTGPFLGIIRAFLHLYKFLQDDINQLSGKHLRFYYEQILGFKRKPAQPDEIHVLFELAKSAKPQKIPTGTNILAGRDALGKTRHYKTQEEIIVNQAKLDQVKTVMIDPAGRVLANEDPRKDQEAWAPFGNATDMKAATVGFGIASHLLWLKEGIRTIEITLSFSDIPAELTREDFLSFNALASGKEAWIPLSLQVGAIIGNQITITLVARPDQSPIEAGKTKKLPGLMTEDVPVLRLELKPEAKNYSRLAALQINHIALQVAVQPSTAVPGLLPDMVQNGQGVLDRKSTFRPFGDAPSVGAYLDIGSREAFRKPLTSFTLQMRWEGLPDQGFNSHYANYGDPTSTYQNTENYKVNLQLLSQGKWTPLRSSQPLFNNTSGILRSNQTITVSSLPLALLEEIPEFSEREAGLSQGFLRLVLQQDFGHQIFPKLYAEQSVSDTPNFPNQPYTPSIQSMSLGYTAEIHQSISSVDQDIQLFHLEPFGHRQIESRAPITLLPSIKRGNLFLGCKDLEPLQNIHFLFQVIEGSNRSLDTLQKEDIAWQYWSTTGWKLLEGSNKFIDTTLGLQQPGVIAFSLGEDLSISNNPLGNALGWIRATIDKNPDGAVRMQMIHTQAVTAFFEDQQNDPLHTSIPLPPDQATKLEIVNRAIRKVKQPYPSRNGKPEEADSRFFARISERLRHKQRAITLWDIERLVLEQFSKIYKVKVIPHTRSLVNGVYSEFSPGHTTIVTIPDWRQQNGRDPLTPKTSGLTLTQIENYIKKYTTAFIGQRQGYIHVINPRYEELQARFSVGFREGFDPGFYSEVLNEELRRHLSPWAYDEGAEISFGGKIYASQLLAFVENREYVDYVTDFKLFQRDTGPGVGESCIKIDLFVYGNGGYFEKETATASTSASILVSSAQHQINVLQPGSYPCEGPEICPGGIGCWYLEIDNTVT